MKSRKKQLIVGTTLLSSEKTRSRKINRLQDKIAQKWPPTVEEKLEGFNANLHAMGWYIYNNAMTGFDSIPAYPSGTKPVAQKQANRWGLHEMHGNVWEWCQDWYAAYPTGSVTDPQGQNDGSYRVNRGGDWYSFASNARSANRNYYTPGDGLNHLGFRLALPPGQ